jgi:hypothetical protein
MTFAECISGGGLGWHIVHRKSIWSTELQLTDAADIIGQMAGFWDLYWVALKIINCMGAYVANPRRRQMGSAVLIAIRQESPYGFMECRVTEVKDGNEYGVGFGIVGW